MKEKKLMKKSGFPKVWILSVWVRERGCIWYLYIKRPLRWLRLWNENWGLSIKIGGGRCYRFNSIRFKENNQSAILLEWDARSSKWQWCIKDDETGTKSTQTKENQKAGIRNHWEQKKKKKNKVREIELWYEAAMKLQCGGVRLGKEGSM